MSVDSEIINDFVEESKVLIHELIEILERIDGDYTLVGQLEEYGNKVDRIMGGAKNIALIAPPDHAMHMIADYTALCKAVGYKAAQIKGNESFFHICVALLLDATEALDQMMGRLQMSLSDLKESLSTTFLERVRWVSKQFDENSRGSVGAGSNAMSQSEIDELMRKMGL